MKSVNAGELFGKLNLFMATGALFTLVGQALGQKNPDDAYKWAWDVCKVSVLLLFVLGLPMWLIPDLISSFFIHEASTRELARWPMRVMGLTMPLEAVSFAFMHGLLGAGDARRVMLVSAGTQWLIFLPLAYLVGPVLGFDQTSTHGCARLGRCSRDRG